MADELADRLPADAVGREPALPGPLVSLEEAAERLLLTRDSAYRLLRRNGLPYVMPRAQAKRARHNRCPWVFPRRGMVG